MKFVVNFTIFANSNSNDMKKLLQKTIMLALICLSVNMKAHVTTFPWNEGFEDETTFSEWTVVHTAGTDATAWARATVYQTQPNTGDYMVRSAGSASYERNDLVSPAIDLETGNRYVLRFYTYTAYPNDYVHSGLVLHLDEYDPENTTNTHEIWVENNPEDSWRIVIIDISAYAGHTVYLDFQKWSENGHGWCLDDVCIEETELQYYSITGEIQPYFGGNVIGYGDYIEGTAVNLIAEGRNGYSFQSWSDGNTQNPRTIIVTNNTTISAQFIDTYEYPEAVTVDMYNEYDQDFELVSEFNKLRRVTFSSEPSNGEWQHHSGDDEIPAHGGYFCAYSDKSYNSPETMNALIIGPLNLATYVGCPNWHRLTFNSLMHDDWSYNDMDVYISKNPSMEGLIQPSSWEEMWTSLSVGYGGDDFYDEIVVDIDIFSFKGGGVYIAFMKDGGCGWAIDDINIRLIIEDDVEENNVSNLKIYPNPAKDFVSISGGNLETLNVYNAVGQLVMNLNLKKENEIDLSEYESGVYIFNIIDNQGNKSIKKIVVE